MRRRIPTIADMGAVKVRMEMMVSPCQKGNGSGYGKVEIWESALKRFKALQMNGRKVNQGTKKLTPGQ